MYRSRIEYIVWKGTQTNTQHKNKPEILISTHLKTDTVSQIIIRSVQSLYVSVSFQIKLLWDEKEVEERLLHIQLYYRFPDEG